MEEKVLLKVEGMDCANCASTITRTLSKEGLKDVSVDFLSGDVSFQNQSKEAVTCAIDSIHKLGYRVKSRSDFEASHASHDHSHHAHATSGSRTELKFLVSLLFTFPLVLHMFLDFPLLHEPWFQLALSIPVMLIGLFHFGRSAYYSARAGVPNMDVLIFIGSTAAFIYSVVGMISYYGTHEVHRYMFFETGATIITLVLLGNLIEQRSVRQTTNAISQLGKLQPQTAKVMPSNGSEVLTVGIDKLEIGNVVIVNAGDRVPADGKIIEGRAVINESMLTGESAPVVRQSGDRVTGGTIVENGSVRFEVDRQLKDTVLARIIDLVRNAQHSKPEIQKLGDRISAIFVPVVLVIAALTFIITAFVVDKTITESLMNAIAVLVISCPCAMGLATPTAVMVGLGRAARNGILVKGGSTAEQLSQVKTFVFDKTGTLTTGSFRIKKIECFDFDEGRLKSLLYALELNSSHPVARALQKELRQFASQEFILKDVSEDRGIGINATDGEGNLYTAGSFQTVRHFNSDRSHDIYVLKNNKLIATVDLQDEIKKDAVETIRILKEKGKRVVMLSGDRKEKCEEVAKATGITEIYFEKLPADKLEILGNLIKDGPTAMVGDGINDAPSLARATVGITISNATDVAIQSAQVILLDKLDLIVLIKALRISELTYSTIRQNLFWAFFYNVVAIPFAAVGLLSPMIGALSMAFSDVIVIGNSLRLRYRK